MGDAGAVLDLAPKSRLGVGPVSSKWWGKGGRKKGEDKQPSFQPIVIFNPTRSLRKIATDGTPGLFPAVTTFRSLRPILGERESAGLQGVVLQREIEIPAVTRERESLSPPDSGCGTNRSASRRAQAICSGDRADPTASSTEPLAVGRVEQLAQRLRWK